MRGYLYLFLSIIFEVIATTFLKLSEGFTILIPSVLLILFYGLSFAVFVFALKTISLSVGYSVWAGLGTAGAALVGLFMFNELMSGLNIIGLVIIIVGVVIMNMNRKEKGEVRAHST